jgi:glycosyltransferase involved in cell wall biosynthesis
MPGGILRLLYIGRLHPIKGIENLLFAVKALSGEKLILSIYGEGDETYSIRLRQLVRHMHLDRCVTFRGHVEGAEKTAAFAQADVCIVPSFTENFGMVVAEALGHGVPVIVSKGAPWADVEKHNCGLWVENAPVELASAISCMRNKSMQEMGVRGRNWMKERYAWNVISAKMLSVYGALLRD